MVFWISIQQISFFDYFRPGDVKNLERISSSHTHQEIIIFENRNSENLFQELKLKMDNPKFRFMKVACNEKKLIKCANYSEEKINKNDFNSSDDNKSYYIKLYKLSDIFQYLSVIEITIDNYEKCDEEKNPKFENYNSAGIEEKNILRSKKNKNMKIIKNVNNAKNGKILHTKMEIKSASVSIFPSFVPLGFVFGFLFIFLPFTDFGNNEKYVKELKTYFDIVENDEKKHDIDSDSKIVKSKREKEINNVIKKENSENEENNFFSDVQEKVLPQSKIFFIFFILFPVLSAALFLLSFQ